MYEALTLFTIALLMNEGACFITNIRLRSLQSYDMFSESLDRGPCWENTPGYPYQLLHVAPLTVG